MEIMVFIYVVPVAVGVSIYLQVGKVGRYAIRTEVL